MRLLRFACLPVLLAGFVHAQVDSPAKLTLEQALRLAKQRNGSVKAAFYDVDTARAQTNEALAAYFPTLNPNYTYTSSRNEYAGPFGKFYLQNEGGQTNVNASWTVLDSGQRNYSVLSARRNQRAFEASAVNTLRQTLYSVYNDYLETLRTQELLRVQDSEVKRYTTILDQTEQQVKVGASAAKDTLQAKADVLNAQVSYLAAKNNYTNAIASLKSVIGWNQKEDLPPLETAMEPGEISLPNLATFIDLGVDQRADLRSSRANLDSLHYAQKRYELIAGPTAAVSVTYGAELTPSVLENRTLTISLNGPFFDGGLSREQARAAKFQYLSAKASYEQQERNAKASIESAYQRVLEDSLRIKSAKQALEASQTNFQAAIEAQKAGSETLIDVLNAQTSLATAESNYIQALYDYILAKVNLDLNTGAQMPGENLK